MKRNSKKIISLFLVFVLLFSMSYSAFAAAAETVSGVSVTLSSNKKQYKSGEEIKIKTKVQNDTEDKQYVSIVYSATPLIKSTGMGKYSIKYAEVSGGETAEYEAMGTARRSVFSVEWIQSIYDAVFGSLWSAIYMIKAMFSSSYEAVSVKVDGVSAVVLAQVTSSETLPGEEDPTEPVVPIDPNDPTDTDNDGFTDYEEIYIMGTDPKEKNDLDADTDGDGLSDDDEVHKYKTDINSKDTDGDGLSDYDEIFVYHTDPLKDDTDGDGLSDKFEVDNKLDPTKTSTDGKTNDSEVKIEQTLSDSSISETLKDDSNFAIPSISGLINGEIDKNVFISTTTDCTVDDNRAMVGKPAYVDSKDEYINGLTLSFDISKYEGDKSTLSICIVNEDGTYALVESESKDAVISCKLNKVGTYFVMDIEEFLKNLGVDLTEYNAPKKLMSRVASTTSDDKEAVISGEKVSGQADIVFAIDTTGSMSDEVENVILNLTDFTNRLATQYNVKVNYALIDFKDLEEDGPGTTKIVKNGHSNWFSDTASFIEKLEAIDIDGGGDDDECDIDALETARRLDWRASSSKFIILITDADYKVANDYGLTSIEEEIELLVKDGIVTSVVTDSSYEESYRSVYETTGGLYANIYSNFSEVLLKLADMIGEQTSDGEWVILKHGYRYVKLPAIPEKDSKTDTDGDGLSDIYELGEAETIDLTPWIIAVLAIKGVPISEYFGKKTITVYNAVSDPSTNDTDNDGILDDKDTAPWSKGLKDGIVGELNLITCYGKSFRSGHSFFAYKSYINDNIDFSMLTNGWQRTNRSLSWSSSNIVQDKSKSGEYAPTSKYYIEPNEYVCIGNGANGAGTISGTSDGSSGGSSAGECNGVNYNMETWKFLLSGRPLGTIDEGVDFSYLENTYISEEITSYNLEKLMNYLGQDSVNYWSLQHNCAKVAADGWNHISSTKVSAFGLEGWHIYPTPSALRDSMHKIDGYKENFQMNIAFP